MLSSPATSQAFSETSDGMQIESHLSGGHSVLVLRVLGIQHRTASVLVAWIS